MPFSPAKQVLVILGAFRGSAKAAAKENQSQPNLQLARLLVFRARISALTCFLINNIRWILLILVVAFFVLQIFAGALTVLRGKNQPPYKQYGYAAPIEKISVSGNVDHRRFTGSNISRIRWRCHSSDSSPKSFFLLTK
jgi:hypothetical protein